MRALILDPESLKIALGEPGWLKIVVPNRDGRRFATMAHLIAVTCPEESLELFERMREDRRYRPVLTARDTEGNTVGALIVGFAIEKDMKRRLTVGRLMASMLREEFGESMEALRGRVKIDIVIDTGEKSELKERIANTLKDNPELGCILKMGAHDGGFTVAHMMADDRYLGAELIGMLKEKPLFLEIMQLRDNEGRFPVSTVLIKSCIDPLFEALETAPSEVTRRILAEKLEDSEGNDLHTAHLLITDPHYYKRLDDLLKSDIALESIYDLKLHSLRDESWYTTRELIAKATRIVLGDVN